MTWLLAAWRFIASPAGRIIAAVGGIALAIVGIRADARRDERRKREAEAFRDRVRRTDAGRAEAEKAAQAMRDGKSPDEIVRQNDGRWRR